MVVLVGVFVTSLDVFIVNTGFPDLERGFSGSSLSVLSWVLNAHAIVFAALLVPRAGRRTARAASGRCSPDWSSCPHIFVLRRPRKRSLPTPPARKAHT